MDCVGVGRQVVREVKIKVGQYKRGYAGAVRDEDEAEDLNLYLPDRPIYITTLVSANLRQT